MSRTVIDLVSCCLSTFLCDFDIIKIWRILHTLLLFYSNLFKNLPWELRSNKLPWKKLYFMNWAVILKMVSTILNSLLYTLKIVLYILKTNDYIFKVNLLYLKRLYVFGKGWISWLIAMFLAHPRSGLLWRIHDCLLIKIMNCSQPAPRIYEETSKHQKILKTLLT